MIVPTLCVGMPHRTLRVRFGTQSVPCCIPTQSVGTINAVSSLVADPPIHQGVTHHTRQGMSYKRAVLTLGPPVLTGHG